MASPVPLAAAPEGGCRARVPTGGVLTGAPEARFPRRQRTGDAELDDLVRRAVERTGNPNTDLLAEGMASLLRMGLEGTERGALKVVNGALRELRRQFQVFGPFEHVPKVTVFGSARTAADSPIYELADVFARRMVEAGWMVITGAGPGIMQAANEGAGRQHGFGLNIRLPFEQAPNPAVDGDEKLIYFRYFFTRKLAFVREAYAFAFFPGGFGTMDEAFETLTLLQTGKSDLHPVVLLDTPEDGYWERWERFLRAELLDAGLVNESDLTLYRHFHDVDDAVEEIRRFYRNYVSQRYVDGELYLRVRRLPDEAELADINDEFTDILSRGGLRPVAPHAAEVADGDALEYPRLAAGFDQAGFGRLRLLVDRLNSIAGLEDAVGPPDPADQAERDA
ncbi:MAG: TIGR00730 family Rossman fold protein [Acidimicrobiia bacterium]|nr:TIGR00730 family Rossman fold protein [Acidimicrobiia bacterium]